MKFQEIWQNVRILNIPRLTVLDLGLANQEIKVLICSSPKIGWLGLLDTNPIQDIFREKKKDKWRSLHLERQDQNEKVSQIECKLFMES